MKKFIESSEVISNRILRSHIFPIIQHKAKYDFKNEKSCVVKYTPEMDDEVIKLITIKLSKHGYGIHIFDGCFSIDWN